MKKLTQKLVLLAVVLFLTNITIAQNQKYWIYQDQVKPSMQEEYEKVTKEFVAECKKYNLENADWVTARLSDGKYLYISAIDKMADLDKRTFAPLAEKMGKENLQKYWDRFDKCYDKNGSYIVTLEKDLSYIQPGVDISTSGQDYRKYHFFYVTPSNSKNLVEKIKAIKALYEKKKSKEYYRIYHSGFGVIGEYYVAVIAAKDEISYNKTSDENDVLLGDEGKKVFGELMMFTDKYENITGNMRPDLSYIFKK